MQSLTSTLARALGFSPFAWIRDTRRMRHLVSDFRQPPSPKPEAIHFAVIITPWMGTAVPWFSLACGLFLASRGNRIAFVIDDMPFGDRPLRFRFVVRCVRSVLRLLPEQYEVIRLGDCVAETPLSVAAQRSVDRLAQLNAVWALRGEMSTDGRRRYTERAIRQLGTSYGAIADVFRSGRYDAVFVPGGVWGSSGIWTEQAREAGVRLASFDSGGYGTLMLAADGVACQLQDIPRALSLLKAHAASPEQRAFIAASAQAEMDRRRSGTDRFASQMKNAAQLDARFSGAVLIALNSSWDSAALGLHAVFESSSEWIVETVRFLLDNTSAPVVVRQHPAERLEIARTSDDYRALLTRHFANHPRLHFIAADEPVNSYDVLEQVAAVVVYTSTIGIEAAVHGKAVVTASRSYYSDLGFVRQATNLEQYRQYLSEAAHGLHPVTPPMREDALSCYYLTQCCNWVFSPFNPEGFTEWSRLDLAQLEQHEKVRVTVTSLEQNIPVAFLNHLALAEHQRRLSVP